jgi:CBS domain-containing protein
MLNWNQNHNSPDQNSDSTAELFHSVNRAIPEDQVLLSIEPDCLVSEALQLMGKHNFSQVPVVSAGDVMGVFTYRRFSAGIGQISLANWNAEKSAPSDLRVDEFLEQWRFWGTTEDVSRILASVNENGGALIGSGSNLVAILTHYDLTNYLYKVASPFVLVAEIELAIRHLIQSILDESEIESLAKLTLGSVHPKGTAIPLKIGDMSFGNYETLITHREGWKRIGQVLHGSRNRTGGKLKEIRGIRNQLFHFKRDISLEEHQKLSDHRDWLFTKIQQVSTHLSSQKEGEPR